MKKQGVELHKVYAAKVSGKVVPVRLDSTSPHGGWNCTNMVTRKPCRVATAQRLRGLWPKKTLPIVAEKDDSKADDKGVAETVAAVEKGNLAEGVTVPETNRDHAADGQAADEKATTTSASKAKKGRKAASEARPASQVAAQTTRPSLLNLAAIALAEAGQPLNCKEMVEKVLATGLWQTSGKTPSATLYSAILREVTTKGEAARFRKVERGKFVAVSK
jgi:hypothetical protein